MKKKPPFPGTPQEKPDLDGVTIMMTAAQFNLVDKIAEYVKAKHNINAVDKAQQNALFHAVNEGAEDAAKMLMFHKIDLAHQNRAGELALHIAAEKKMNEVVERWVLAKGPLDVQDKVTKSTPLMKAIKADDIWAAVRLIDAGADFKTLQDANGRNAVELGLRQFEDKDLEFFKLAMKRRFDAEAAQAQALRTEIVQAASTLGHDVAAPEKASFRKKTPSPSK